MLNQIQRKQRHFLDAAAAAVTALKLILIIMQMAHVPILMGAKDTFELQTICYIL